MIVQGYRTVKLIEKILKENRLNAVAYQLIEKLPDVFHLLILDSPTVDGYFHDRCLFECDILMSVASKEVTES
jgi:hypothetical protein